VDANPVDAEQVAGEAERLATWREQLAALQHRVRVYEKTLAIIQQCESGTMRKATRFLEHQVGRDIARLTGGRYRRVTIDDQSLDLAIFAPERGDWVPAARLSKGTVDQLFLAARIGLVRLVTQGRRPPLILDDPFVTFDDARASRAAIMLRELSSDFQVIYLTCSNRYDGLADRVVALPGPTEAEHAAAARAAASAVQPDEAATPADEPAVAETEGGEDEAAIEINGAGSAAIEADAAAPEATESGEREPETAEGTTGRAEGKDVLQASAEPADAEAEQQGELEAVDPDEFGERLVVVDDPNAEDLADDQGDGERNGFVWHDSDEGPGDGAATPLPDPAEQET
jgi:hypothetical protein